MTELEMITLLQDVLAQITEIFGQIVAITFAMVVATYYFLNTASLRLRIAAFTLYSIGMIMYFLLAVRQSVLSGALAAQYETADPQTIGPILSAIRDFSDTPVALMLNLSLNLSAIALWIGIFYLVFIWKKVSKTA